MQNRKSAYLIWLNSNGLYFYKAEGRKAAVPEENLEESRRAPREFCRNQSLDKIWRTFFRKVRESCQRAALENIFINYN